ncbi:hypothetical protein ABGB16_03330 [Micromonospora sp. B11E3]|uniref:hypothetical protein n=1 Tax=Micromonospora sp. B11E3 TaxID=3153562 RepID=UPI00325CCFD3
MDSMTRPGRLARLVVTVLAAGLLVAGTVAGSDDDFPFGPFKMYAYADSPDDPVSEALVLAATDTGRRIILTENDTGVRRAEVEGQVGRFTADPTELRIIAHAYRRRHPDVRLATVSVIIRRHELSDGRPTGSFRDEVVAQWQVPR